MKREIAHFFNGDLHFNVVPILYAIHNIEHAGGFSIGEKYVFVSSRETISKYHSFDFGELRLRVVCLQSGILGHIQKALYILSKFQRRIVFHGHKGWAGIFSRVPFMDVSVVCWNVGAQEIKNPRKWLYSRLKYCKNVYCLMTPDVKVCRNAGLFQTKLCPYGGGFSDGDTVGVDYGEPRRSGLRVLLGNSCWSIQGYMEVLPKLRRFDSIRQISCMVSYGNIEDHAREISCLEETGKSLFGERFNLIKDLMPLSAFRKFVGTYDVYISPNTTQGGLGAIHTMLIKGGKVFLAGFNYEWEVESGFKVFQVEELDCVRDIMDRFTSTDRRCNAEKMLANYGVEENIARYKKYYT